MMHKPFFSVNSSITSDSLLKGSNWTGLNWSLFCPSRVKERGKKWSKVSSCNFLIVLITVNEEPLVFSQQLIQNSPCPNFTEIMIESTDLPLSLVHFAQRLQNVREMAVLL